MDRSGSNEDIYPLAVICHPDADSTNLQVFKTRDLSRLHNLCSKVWHFDDFAVMSRQSFLRLDNVKTNVCVCANRGVHPSVIDSPSVGQGRLRVHLFEKQRHFYRRYFADTLQVLWVLASGVNDRVFDEKGAHAIINLAWREAYRAHFLTFALDACLPMSRSGICALDVIVGYSRCKSRVE